MIRIDTPDHLFHNTPPTCDWLNSIQDEVCSLIEEELPCLTPDPQQLYQAVMELMTTETKPVQIIKYQFTKDATLKLTAIISSDDAPSFFVFIVLV